MDQALKIIKYFEGCYLTPYRDPVGYWTVGWGHLLSRDKTLAMPPRITQEQAEDFLAGDVAKTAKALQGLSLPVLRPSQYAALLDFAFNLGAGSLRISTLLRKIKDGAPMDEIVFEFGRWDKAGGQVVKGLKTRRAGEVMLWISGYFDPSQLPDYIKLFD